jgi:transcriptional regulator with XRE-family HTH domain
LRLADGARSHKELAKLTGSTVGSVTLALHTMRQLGLAVKSRAKGQAQEEQKCELHPSDFEQFRVFREHGMTWKQIAQRLGISEAWAWKRAQRLSAAFGSLPGRSNLKKKKDPARDYIRIKELRVDAQLPWETVAKNLGMKKYYISKYFRELCKVYSHEM